MANNQISASDAEKWLEANPHRKAENMDKVASQAKPLTIRRSITQMYEANKAERAKRMRESALRGSRAPRESNKTDRVFNSVKSKLRRGDVVVIEDFCDISKTGRFRILQELREQGFDILTLVRAQKTVGWCVASVVLDGDK